MFLPDTSIKRPVLTLVVSMTILLAGWLGYRNLAVRELPNVEYPIVSVSTALPGASPTVVETNVTKPLEEQINTIEGLKTLTSISGEGASQITAEFDLSRDVDLALQDVRAKVSLARGGSRRTPRIRSSRRWTRTPSRSSGSASRTRPWGSRRSTTSPTT